MEHSVQAYLARRATEELELLLLSCLHEESSEHDKNIASTVREILKQRSSKDTAE